MGNFSINHYSRIEVGKDAFSLKYIVDMAEIPTFQEIGKIDKDDDKEFSAEERDDYLAEMAEDLKKGLSLELNDSRVEFTPERSEMVVIPGAGGLPTFKIAVEYRAAFEKDVLLELNKVSYKDGNFPGRTGWKEVIVVGEGEVSIVNSTAPTEDKSNELSTYSEDTLSAPPQDLEASFSFTQRSGPMQVGYINADSGHSEITGAQKPRNSFTDIITREELTPSVILLALVIAFGLGAFHALSPGHGKTVVAAYLVGSRGTAGHALLLGTIVTLTHTIGVFALGFVTLFASKYILPEKLYPWLGFISGLIIVSIGMVLFRDRYYSIYGADLHEHGDGHRHSHSHVHDQHEHGHEHHHHHISEKVAFKDLLGLGVSGGIVPCPEALIVLLSAISLHRVGFGLVLILAFSVGLAIVLMGIGLMMVYMRQFLERFSGDGGIIRRLPLFSSVVIIVLGSAIAVQSLVSGGIIEVSPPDIVGRIL